MIEVVSIVVPALAAVLVALAKAGVFRRFAQRQMAVRTLETLRVGSEIHNLLQELKITLNAQHVVLLKAENGGGVPRPGSTLRSSVVIEAGGHGILKAWDRQRVDSQYIEMLCDLLARGQLVLTTDTLEPSMLKDLYAAKQVSHSLVTSVGFGDNAFFYLSIVFREDGLGHTPAARAAARAITSTIVRKLDLSLHTGSDSD